MTTATKTKNGYYCPSSDTWHRTFAAAKKAAKKIGEPVTIWLYRSGTATYAGSAG